VKIRDTQLEMLVLKGHKRARATRHIISHLDAYLSATQLGITIASLALGWVGHPVFNYLLEPVMNAMGMESPELRHMFPVLIGFSVITFLHIVVGELAPKSLAIQKPLPTSLWVSTPLLWFYKLTYPFIWLLNGAALWLLRRLGIRPASEAELGHSEEELRLLIGSSQVEAGTSALGRDVVLNALDLRRRIAREVMRPRREIVVLNTAASISECLFTAESTRYSRFPLCEDGNLDKTLGAVHFKDLFALRLSARRGADLRAVMRALIYVPETARLEKLLQFFLERKLHMAMVVDEYGGTVGLVTLENILEELVGPIQDEFDQEKALLHQLNDRTWIVDGALPLHELEELVGEQLPGEGITTTSGWVTQQVAGFPKAGDVLSLADYELRVEEVHDMRVSRLQLVRKPKTEEEAG
jgi:CBS domain containing-hemolysin-like protein